VRDPLLFVVPKVYVSPEVHFESTPPVDPVGTTCFANTWMLGRATPAVVWVSTVSPGIAIVPVAAPPGVTVSGAPRVAPT
jgi:hypothetical protein